MTYARDPNICKRRPTRCVVTHVPQTWNYLAHATPHLTFGETRSFIERALLVAGPGNRRPWL